jgi:SAM-dependent methyltransferase
MKNWLVKYLTVKELKKLVPKYVKGCLIDIGCGSKPYENIIKKYADRYIGTDHSHSISDKSKLDFLGTAYSIGIKSETFDTALSTAVLEHLEEPESALRECYRLLKSGGHAIYAVPFIWHIHEEPRDFYRYSKYGLQYLFQKTGFEIIELKSLSGFCVTFSQLLVYYLYIFHRGPVKLIPIIPLLGLFIQLLGLALDSLYKADRWTWAYLVVARKKGA